LTTSDNKRQGRPKSEEKRQQILSAASCLFLSEGFANTSMDKVAKASGVSKQTVYSHFDNKDTLFQAAISAKCQSYQLDTSQLMEAGLKEMPFSTCMMHIGDLFIRLLQDPDTVAVFRILIAESGTNQHMAELFYDAGPHASLRYIADIIYTYGGGTISQPQCQQLANDFISLLKGDFHIMMLCGIQPILSDEEIQQHVLNAVEKIVVWFELYKNQ